MIKIFLCLNEDLKGFSDFVVLFVLESPSYKYGPLPALKG